ncbi:ANTAR domain-containing protein [Streptomyces sp. LRE541]|uniref:ANTAR domain-containing protein n=1 Tax=Streptomyces sp. LRE541 TaxID=2931983 RepID=UPI00200F8CF2|nr:ANTAR domain-containing protein [Streptomyces sp. LRE541]UPZ26408.1 ANTAR domain-containing protein [Streptomyces sp. LRE541]
MRSTPRPDPRRGRTGGPSPGIAPRGGRPGSCPRADTGHFPAEPADALREEIGQLHEALTRRPVIDMARGIRMTVWSCTEDEAWELLVYVSQHTNTKL